jgi:cytochrome c553
VEACKACHGPQGVSRNPTFPNLAGQKAQYLEVQLQAFASGTRHNDIGAQMRGIARALTPQEIASLAAYYASAPGGLTASQPASTGQR